MLLVCWCVRSLGGSTAEAVDTPSVTFGATVNPTLQLSINGGVNAYGKRTLFIGSGVDFGVVTFTHPDLVGNGDAYLSGGNLMLESILDVTATFSGLPSVRIDLSKFVGAANPFKHTYCSLAVNRAEPLVEILVEPQANHLTAMTTPGTFTLRMVFEIIAQQGGMLADRFRLLAGA